MSANPHWEVSLARTADMVGINPLPYAFSLTPIFNRPGTFSMTLPLDDDAAYQVAKHATCVICERNDLIRWSGEIVSVNRDPAAMTMSLTAIGWLDELNHRFVRADEEAALTFVNVVGGSIVEALIASVNAQKDTSLITRPTHLGFSSYQDTQVRTRSYKRSQNYGQAIQELSDIENGLDIYVDPRTRLITTKSPTSFSDRTDTVFGYGVEPFNLSNAPQSDDGTNTANRITAVGANGVAIPADDAAAIDAQAGMREAWLSLSDVGDPIIIGAYANAELVYQRWGQITYTLQPLAYGDIPRLWDDFELGDQVYLSIGNAGALSVDGQGVRVFTATLDVDAQGNETISQIGTSPQQ
jgi:hypothetical protein